MNNMNESGRSMVEMLGVLAIIGVLSVMGIAGYTQAMKKYKANEAAQEISMGAMLCGTTGSLGGFAAPHVVNLTCDENTKAVSWDGVGSGIEESAVNALLAKERGFSGADRTFALIS